MQILTSSHQDAACLHFQLIGSHKNRSSALKEAGKQDGGQIKEKNGISVRPWTMCGKDCYEAKTCLYLCPTTTVLCPQQIPSPVRIEKRKRVRSFSNNSTSPISILSLNGKQALRSRWRYFQVQAVLPETLYKCSS